MFCFRSFERAFQIYQQCQIMISMLNKDKENSQNEKLNEESLIDFKSENQFNANIIEFHPEPSSTTKTWVSFD